MAALAFPKSWWGILNSQDRSLTGSKPCIAWWAEPGDVPELWNLQLAARILSPVLWPLAT
jgi:hypothetical protein